MIAITQFTHLPFCATEMCTVYELKIAQIQVVITAKNPAIFLSLIEDLEKRLPVPIPFFFFFVHSFCNACVRWDSFIIKPDTIILRLFVHTEQAEATESTECSSKRFKSIPLDFNHLYFNIPFMHIFFLCSREISTDNIFSFRGGT